MSDANLFNGRKEAQKAQKNNHSIVHLCQASLSGHPALPRGMRLCGH
jgi:hypothetical protein